MTASSYTDLSLLLTDLDPYRWRIDERTAAQPRGVAHVRRQIEAVRRRALAELAARPMSDMVAALADVDGNRQFGLLETVPALNGRHAVVLAHGPSLTGLLPKLRANRSRLFVVAPFRTALRLAKAGVRADVAVLADISGVAYDVSKAEWRQMPDALRRAIEAQTTLIVEPLAPASIHASFARAVVFDEGFGWLPSGASLPFWGSALLPSICLPFALGAQVVGIGGFDMLAERGVRRTTWSGRDVRLEPRMVVAHRLIEIVATTLGNRLVDLTRESVVKRGAAAISLSRFLRRRPDSGPGLSGGHDTVRAGEMLQQLLQPAEGLSNVIDRMSTVAADAARLARARRESPLLAKLVREMEEAWSLDPKCQAALTLVEATYLRAFWQLRRYRIAGTSAGCAWRKATLIAPEIADLDAAYRTWLATVRQTILKTA